MMESYINYIESFKELNVDDKKEEIIKNFNELFNLLYTYNNNFDLDKGLLPVFKSYENEDEFLNLIFSYIISFKEENAKLIKFINENNNN